MPHIFYLSASRRTDLYKCLLNDCIGMDWNYGWETVLIIQSPWDNSWWIQMMRERGNQDSGRDRRRDWRRKSGQDLSTHWMWKKYSKTLIQGDRLKDYARERNGDVLLSLNRLILTSFWAWREDSSWISLQCSLEIDLGESLRRIQEDKKERFALVLLDELYSAEEEKKFELNIFLVRTSCKCSVW